jgi:hypothetical protein
LWLLSLQRSLVASLEAVDAPALIARVVRIGQPTKVLRIALATIVAILKCPTTSRATSRALAESGVSATVAALANAEPPVADPELADDVRWLGDSLAKLQAAAPTDAVDRYAQDLAAGRAEWTAVHSAEFWRENARAFEKDGFALLRELGKLLDVRLVDRRRDPGVMRGR